MLNSLDERQGYLPFFSYELAHPPATLRHGEFDTPHVTGRVLDAISSCGSIVAIPEWSEPRAALSEQIFESLAYHQSGLPRNRATPWQPGVVALHNIREALFGLIAIHRLTGDQGPIAASMKLCTALLDFLGAEAVMQGDSLDESGWSTAYRGMLSSVPATLGRSIQPLVELGRLTGSDLPIDVAAEIAARTVRAFSESGEVLPSAGPHIHSITCSMVGLFLFGTETSDTGLLDVVRNAFYTGMGPWRSSYGWVKEFRFGPDDIDLMPGAYPGRDIPRGEANCSADLVEMALLLAGAGDERGFDEVDRILRNHLLASQVVASDWIREGEGHDTDGVRYTDVARRAVGGFCFTGPADVLADTHETNQLNTDLAGGAIQAISRAWTAITNDEADRTRINLLFSTETPSVRMTCPPPGGEPIEVELRRNASLEVRIPWWAAGSVARFQIDDGEMQRRPLATERVLVMPDLAVGAKVRVWFPDRQETVVEEICGRDVPVLWHNGAVAGLDDDIGFMPLYPARCR